MRSQLDRAIKLAANTGDKIIVVDELNDRSSVVMSLDDYEGLLNGQNKRNNEAENLTDEELFDRINCDTDSEDDLEDDGDEEILPDFTASNFNAEGDIISEEDTDEEPKNTPISVPLSETVAEKAEDNETLYYYNEPSSAEATAGKPESDKEDSGFTSIKDELKKNRKAWEIPAEVKEAAEEVGF